MPISSVTFECYHFPFQLYRSRHSYFPSLQSLINSTRTVIVDAGLRFHQNDSFFSMRSILHLMFVQERKLNLRCRISCMYSIEYISPSVLSMSPIVTQSFIFPSTAICITGNVHRAYSRLAPKGACSVAQ